MKYQIQVRKVEPGKLYNSSAPFEVIGTIKRQVRAEQIGNFNPMFCTYQGQRTLVHSDCGDLSDPFRRDESYGKSLFIRVS